jgi:membrane-bound lytic murein transglycosylase D
VPKLQAMKNIVLRPADHGLTLPVLENHPYFLVVPITRDIDVALITRLSGLPLEQFKQLNPQINRPLVVAAGTPQLLLPYDNANTFVKSLPLHKGPLASWTAWTAPRTMKIADVARAVGMDEEELREVNAIPPRMLVQSGSTLLVQRGRHRSDDVSERIADSGVLTLSPESPPLRRITLKVGKGGDSVAAVAKRHGVAAHQVAQWNKVAPSARFAAGSTVIVYVTTRASQAAKSVTGKSTRRATTGPTRIQRGSSGARTRRTP